MKAFRNAMLALAVMVALVGLTSAGDDKEVTLTGEIKCAKCAMHKADASGCQDVLVAADKTEYYMVKNAVAEKFGHTCKGEKSASVTGKVSEKEGKKWIEASKIEEAKKG